MKLKYLIFLIIVTFLLVSCAKQEVKQEQVSKVVEEKVKEITKEINQYVLPEEIKLLLKKTEEVKSMQYGYTDYRNSPRIDDFFVKGDKMKIKLAKTTVYNATDYFDTVYLDLTTREAIAYCEDKKRCDESMQKKSYNVAFEKYYRETPLDWMNKLKNAIDFVKIDSVMLENKNALHYSFKLNNKEGEIWIWDYYGLPLKILYDGKIYKFLSLSVNSLTDKDVVKE